MTVQNFWADMESIIEDTFLSIWNYVAMTVKILIYTMNSWSWNHVILKKVGKLNKLSSDLPRAKEE